MSEVDFEQSCGGFERVTFLVAALILTVVLAALILAAAVFLFTLLGECFL